MVRTQIQLTEDQTALIKRIAATEGVSMAEIIRRAIAGMAGSKAGSDPEERYRRARAVVGKFRSGKRDVSEKHDAHAVEAYSR
jgi:hypothetical protein